MYAFMQSIQFVAGVFVLYSGVRLLLNELVPAFRGIAIRGARAFSDNFSDRSLHQIADSTEVPQGHIVRPGNAPDHRLRQGRH